MNDLASITYRQGSVEGIFGRGIKGHLGEVDRRREMGGYINVTWESMYGKEIALQSLNRGG